jgi:phage-related protein
VSYTIEYYSAEVQEEILALPATLAARYIVLTRRMEVVGANLGAPHTEPLGGGLFELRLKGQEGIARVLYCALVGRRVMMLKSFIKKTQKTPPEELKIARKRMKEVKNAKPQ